MAKFEKTLRCLERGIEAGLHPGAQIAVIRDGELILNQALGKNESSKPLTTDHWMPWLSSGKPITAVAILQLWEQGKIDLDEPVAQFIPAFGQKGKEAITLRHLLTHTGGFREGDKVPEHYSWEEAIDRVCAAPLETGWEPGKKAGYHINGSWFILGELIRITSGQPVESHVRDHVLLPCGMDDSWMAVPEPVLDENRERIGIMHLTHGEGPEPHPNLNRERTWLSPRPGSSLRGPICELARFYQMLLNGGELDGNRVLESKTVEAMTRRQREGMFDETFRHVMDWGWGVIVNSNRHGPGTVPYGFGRHASDASFGHGGMQCSCGFADLEKRLALAWVCNGMPGEPKHQLRARELNTAIYEDLA